MKKIVLADFEPCILFALGIALKKNYRVEIVDLRNVYQGPNPLEQIKIANADLVLFEPVGFLDLYRLKNYPTIQQVADFLSQLALEVKIILFTICDSVELPKQMQMHKIIHKPATTEEILSALVD